MGKAHALRVTGANAAWGRNYSREFSEWIKQRGFDAMAKSVRSVAIELHENGAKALKRGGQRRRSGNGEGLCIRYRTSAAGEPHFIMATASAPTDLKRDAGAAWRRFVSCVELLPPDQAAPLWQIAHAQAATELAHG